MIHQKDLRLGDLVQITVDLPEYKQGDTFVVIDISEVYIGLRSPSESDCRPDMYTIRDHIEGIPLTPDIFNKNDFTEEVVGEYNTKPLDNETHPFKRYLSVERESDNWAVFIKYRRLYDNALLRKIQHVHELQHILWALGLDANLKI